MLFFMTTIAPMHAIKKMLNSYWTAVVFWLAVLVLMCTPGQDLPRLGSWTELINLDKIIHILLFGTMTYLFIQPTFHRLKNKATAAAVFLKITLAVCIWGLTTEFIQQFWVQGRTFDLFDFLADSVGAFAAYFYARKYVHKQPETS